MEEDIKILEEMIEKANVENADMNDCFGGEHIEAIENLLKENKTSKEAINTLTNKLEKVVDDNNELRKYYASRKEVEDLKETIACLHESSKEMFIPISVIQNILDELQIDRNAIKKEIEEAKKEKNKEYYADLLSHLRVNYGAIAVLNEILEKGNK